MLIQLTGLIWTRSSWKTVNRWMTLRRVLIHGSVGSSFFSTFRKVTILITSWFDGQKLRNLYTMLILKAPSIIDLEIYHPIIRGTKNVYCKSRNDLLLRDHYLYYDFLCTFFKIIIFHCTLMGVPYVQPRPSEISLIWQMTLQYDRLLR